MGVNNRARRAAKRRKRAQAHGAGAAGSRPSPWYEDGSRFDERAAAAALVLQMVAEIEHDASVAAKNAGLLSGPEGAVALPVVADVVDTLLTEVVAADIAGGWTPSDLAQIVGRRLSVRHLPALAAVLAVQTDRHAPQRVSSQWRAELAGVGPAQAVDLTTTRGLGLALGLCAVLGALPRVATVLPPPGSPVASIREVRGRDSKQLARVRALLAKAESTQYDEEAEALSAKAQELISRYALEKLLDEREHAEPLDGSPVTARRLWIDPPYMLPKAMLVDAVAGANRCSSVITEQLGFSTVIGAPDDLDAIELLATSLLVQADTAMLRRGHHTDRRGTSRTRSYRRSFLVAYASRISGRLRAASADAVEDAGGSGALVPLLHRRQQQVDSARDRLFPWAVTRQPTISNGLGWAAGRAAADLALLDADLRPITESA